MTTVTALPSKDMANTSLVQDFKASLLPVIEKERALWLLMLGYMQNEMLSVRGAKATIEAVNTESGSLPTIATTQAQYFLSAGVVYETVQGTSEVPLKALINVTIQGTRKLGKKGFAELVKVTSNFKALASTVEKAPAKEKAEGKPKVEGVEALIKALLEAFDDEDFDGLIPNIEEGESLIKRMSALVKHSKQVNHPSVVNG